MSEVTIYTSEVTRTLVLDNAVREQVVSACMFGEHIEIVGGSGARYIYAPGAITHVLVHPEE